MVFPHSWRNMRRSGPGVDDRHPPTKAGSKGAGKRLQTLVLRIYALRGGCLRDVVSKTHEQVGVFGVANAASDA
jgi:hypothetical protein